MAELQPPNLECPICFAPYDNAFKTPLKLPVCSHTFCLECLSQMCLFLKPLQIFHCPLCRAPVPVPPGGAPSMPPNMEVVSQLPPSQRGPLRRVWLQGSQLCYWKLQPPYSEGQEELGQDAVVRLQLIQAPPGQPSPPRQADLIPVRAQRRLLFRQACRNVWCLGMVLLISTIMLFSAIFFPVYTNWHWNKNSGRPG
ncbi:RING finger protein 223-like [Acipenser ruthenus]|uniref:RING finger protein 223-like n=1 Tax=Acipenser ruthenus TaxID=7906 RepID=UPI00145AB3A7|nr:RING finger protein 223-like [Acipenser ruthenus]